MAYNELVPSTVFPTWQAVFNRVSPPPFADSRSPLVADEMTWDSHPQTDNRSSVSPSTYAGGDAYILQLYKVRSGLPRIGASLELNPFWCYRTASRRRT